MTTCSTDYWRPITEDWREIEGERTQLVGPWECPFCGGHVMLDFIMYDQLGGSVFSNNDKAVNFQDCGEEYCFCPYCLHKLHYPARWPEED